MEKKYLEKIILKKVDEFIWIIIDLSSRKEHKIKQIALNKATELIPVLLEFLNGNKVHVEPLFYQLVFEKIPDKTLLTSFGDFQVLLNEIIHESCLKYFQNTENSIIIKNVIKEEKKNIYSNNFQKLIFRIYPSEKICFNYYFRGFIINAFLPEKKIAIYVNEHKIKKIHVLKYLCQKHGIKLFKLDELNNYRGLKKYKNL